MSALPVISTAVSAIGVVSSIGQQRKAAELQASAIDDERTNAIIQSELAAAQQKQQLTIASTMQEIEALNAETQAMLQSRQAEVIYKDYQAQTEQARQNIDAQLILAQQQAAQAKSQLAQQKLEADASILQGQQEGTQSINQAKQRAAAYSDEDLSLAARVALANRLNRLGVTTAQQTASFDEQQRRRRAELDSLEQSRIGLEKQSEEILANNEQVKQALTEVADLEKRQAEEKADQAKSQLEIDAEAAKRSLEEYQAVIGTALASGKRGAELQKFLLEQQNVAANRARELGLAANLTALNNQAASIQKPGLFDLLAGGLNVFQSYQAMKQQQQRISDINQRAIDISRRPLAPPDAVNPYYIPGTQPFSLPTPTEGLQIPTGGR